MTSNYSSRLQARAFWTISLIVVKRVYIGTHDHYFYGNVSWRCQLFYAIVAKLSESVLLGNQIIWTFWVCWIAIFPSCRCLQGEDIVPNILNQCTVRVHFLMFAHLDQHIPTSSRKRESMWRIPRNCMKKTNEERNIKIMSTNAIEVDVCETSLLTHENEFIELYNTKYYSPATCWRYRERLTT